MPKSLHIFVCSTYRDLVSERSAVCDGLEELSAQYPDLTFFCARSIQPLKTCFEEIKRSDLLILIVGHLQGVIAPGTDISYGEAEYHEGKKLDTTIFVYFRDEKVGLYPSHFERDPARASQLKSFKQKISTSQAPKIFGDQSSLVNQILNDLKSKCSELGLTPSINPKNNRFKSKAGVTRKAPIVIGSQPIENPDENATRTIPVLQKALATPYKRRKSGLGKIGKGFLIALGSIVIAGIGFTKFNKRPLFNTHMANGNMHSDSNGAFGSTGTLEGHDNTSGSGKIGGQNSLGSDNADSASLPIESALGIADPSLAVNGGATGMVADINPSTKSIAPAIPTNSNPAKSNQKPKPISNSTVVMMDDADSTKALLRKAANGSPADQFHLGQLYEKGQGFPRNESIAFDWYKKSALLGWVEAEYKIGMMYKTGLGTKRNNYLAYKWFQVAADKGLAKAQVQLGLMYQAGKGVQRNETLAFKWFLKAADQKDPEAEKILGELRKN